MKTILFTILLTVTICSCSTTNNTSCGGHYLEPVVYINPATASHEDSLNVANTDYLTWGYRKRNKTKKPDH